MDASKVLSVLYSEIHSVVVGMIDSEGHPSSAFLDVMFAEENAVYFMTSDNGRKLYHLLNSSDYISICGKTEGDYFHAKCIFCMISMNPSKASCCSGVSLFQFVKGFSFKHKTSSQQAAYRFFNISNQIHYRFFELSTPCSNIS